MIARLFLCLVVLAGLLGPVRTSAAQDLTPARVQDALDQTDRRIEGAEMLTAESGNTNAQFEVGLARDIQIRARTAYTAAQLAFALRLTMDARGHADRAVAIVRNLPDPDRVRVQVERTNDLLERLRDRLRECEDNRARSLMRVAIEMQTRAGSALAESRFLAALQLTMSARERALKAMRLCKLQDSFQESVTRALGRTDDMLTRAREVLSGADEPRAIAMLRSAEHLQAEAQTEYRAGHGEQALRMTQSARAFAHRAIRSATVKSR
ncbi:MAG: hypothetical protein ABIU54_13965 [Candidatus Eisenbacteria bacterium]